MKPNAQSYRAVKRAVIAERRAKVSELYLTHGWTVYAIAKELNCAPSTVSEDLHALIEQWKKTANVDVAAHRAAELARLNGVEAQAWESFEKSKGQKKVATASKKSDADGSTVVASMTKIDRNEGDPRFLKLILDCIAKRCEILGLVGGEKEEDKSKGFKTLEGFVAAHSKSDGQNRKGGAQMATKPSPLHLDPDRLP